MIKTTFEVLDIVWKHSLEFSIYVVLKHVIKFNKRHSGQSYTMLAVIHCTLSLLRLDIQTSLMVAIISIFIVIFFNLLKVIF